MGKHRNLAQEKIFIEFMECHQDIAKGYVKGDRVAADANWAELTEQLNSSGPPTKDCNGWKKTWADWKVYVKKKLCHIKKENEITGGGSFNKYILSNVEESLARVSGLHRSVEGIGSGLHRTVESIAGAKSFGDVDLSIYLCESEKENDEKELDVTPSTSKSAKRKNLITTNNEMCSLNSTSSASNRRLSRTPSSDSKRYRPHTPKPDFNILLKENKHLKSIVQLMEDQRTDIKLEKIVHLMEEQREEMKIQNQKLDRLCNILENHYKARQLNDLEMQKKLREKNELKLKLIEIETLYLSRIFCKSKILYK